MKIKIILGSILLLLSHSLWAVTKQNTQSLDKIVAVVNSEIVTQSELNQQLNLLKQQLRSSNASMPDAATLRTQVLDQLIDQKMLFELAKRNNVTITDAQLNEAVRTIAAHNNLTLDQFKIAVQKEGMDFANFQKQLRTQILIQQVEERALAPTIQVSPEEVKAFLKQQPNSSAQYQVVDYLLPANLANQSQTILTQLQKNGTTPAGVTTNSLGWRTLQNMPEIFAEKIAVMKINEIAGPIQAPNGIHFIKLIGVHSTGQKLTEQEARQMLLQRKFAEKVKPWLKQLRASAYIKIMN